MTTPAQVGKREYRAAIAKMREDEKTELRLLTRIIESTQDSKLQSLIGRIALLVADEQHQINRLDEIGKQAAGR